MSPTYDHNLCSTKPSPGKFYLENQRSLGLLQTLQRVCEGGVTNGDDKLTHILVAFSRLPPSKRDSNESDDLEPDVTEIGVS